MKRILSWIPTVPFLLAFGLALVLFDVAGRIVRPFSLRAFEHVMASLQRTLMSLFRLCGARLVVERPDLVLPDTGYVIISNHQSLLDIAMIGGILYSNFPKYVAKKELGKGIPSISLNLRRGGNALIDRNDRRQSIRAILEMASTAQERNVSVVIFPEGTRSRDGSLGEFKPAGSEALLRAADALPVVPVAVDGCWRLLRYNMMPVPFGETVRIRFGDPLPRTPKDGPEKTAAAHDFIERTLQEWRTPVSRR